MGGYLLTMVQVMSYSTRQGFEDEGEFVGVKHSDIKSCLKAKSYPWNASPSLHY